MNKLHKALALLLCLAVCLTLMPAAFAEEPTGDYLVWEETPAANEAAPVIESIVFCHTSISFTWQELIAVSHDPMFAASVANATMDVLYELDLERQESRRAATIRYLSDAYEHARNDKESHVKRMANAKSEREKSDEEARVAQLSQRMDNCERQIALYREMDVRTNTMFKIMIPAGVATNIVTRRIAQRLRE